MGPIYHGRTLGTPGEVILPPLESLGTPRKGTTEVVAASVVGGPPGKLPSLVSGSAASGGLRRKRRDDLLPLEGAEEVDQATAESWGRRAEGDAEGDGSAERGRRGRKWVPPGAVVELVCRGRRKRVELESEDAKEEESPGRKEGSRLGAEGRRKSVRQVLSACWEEEHPSSLDIQLFDRRRSCEPAHARKIVRIKGTPWLVPRGSTHPLLSSAWEGLLARLRKGAFAPAAQEESRCKQLAPIVIECTRLMLPGSQSMLLGNHLGSTDGDLSLRVHLVCEQVKQVVVRELEDHEVREQKFVRWRWQPTGLCLPRWLLV
ncbi:hypothetical protein MLD38_034536 [Melastoma candidum]|uniref:Uncharacterized protein n=1 Tax=Melastoma candidum TaxID=119954 RepID=A0ACB9MC49_9MYRT|nr:hypothetical protein MLD38_034536 [Melastoma candidum]